MVPTSLRHSDPYVTSFLGIKTLSISSSNRLTVLIAFLLCLATLFSNSAMAQTADFSNAIQTLGSGFGNPTGMTVDGIGNVFVADLGGVRKIPYSGGS